MHGNTGSALALTVCHTIVFTFFYFMPMWRNGRRKGLKIPRSNIRTGSSPVIGTSVAHGDQVNLGCRVFYFLQQVVNCRKVKEGVLWHSFFFSIASCCFGTAYGDYRCFCDTTDCSLHKV